MQWSRLKARLEELFAERVRGRIQVHLTTYRRDRRSDDPLPGRAWITFDGNEMWSASNVDVPDLRQALYQAVEGYPDLPFDQALIHENPLIRGFARLDRRLGKRRLQALGQSPDSDPFVTRMTEIRLIVERIGRSGTSPI